MKIDIKKIQAEKSIKDLIEFGVINIDKPSGPTSYDVSSFVGKSLKTNKSSHMGTLDPKVTGVLPILTGRACRLSNYFMHKNKTYVGIMSLHEDVSKENLQKTVNNFIGKIKQLPPVRSAVKRAIREREIISFKVLEIEGKNVLFETEVQAGTYVRKLIDDMGKELGGAHMLELRRTKAGIFKEDECIDLYQFESAIEQYKKGNEKELRKIIIPAEIISEFLPTFQVNPKSIKQILTGKPLMRKDIKNYNESERFVLFNKDVLVGVYRSTKEKDIIARPEFVLN